MSDDTPLQLVDIDGQGDEKFQDVERVQPYGLTSVPEAGSETVVIHIGGLREHPVAIVIDSSEHRITGLKPGEVCLYSKHGQTILLNEDGETVFNEGTDNAIAYARMKAAFDMLVLNFNALVVAYNAHIASAFASAHGAGTATSTPGVPSVADMSGAQVEKIFFPAKEIAP